MFMFPENVIKYIIEWVSTTDGRLIFIVFCLISILIGLVGDRLNLSKRNPIKIFLIVFNTISMLWIIWFYIFKISDEVLTHFL